LFFALWPDEEFREQLWQATRIAVKAAVGAGAARPVSRDNLHLTLAFLGNVDPELLPKVRAAGAELQMPGFDLTLDQLGFWSRPGILLARPEVIPPALPQLVDGLWKSLAPLQLAAGPGIYRPHITLARKAKSSPTTELAEPLNWRVSDFCLVSSITDPAGARYEPLARYHLIQPVAGASGE
jgi:2'-5' RNA ligase